MELWHDWFPKQNLHRSNFFSDHIFLNIIFLFYFPLSLWFLSLKKLLQILIFSINQFIQLVHLFVCISISSNWIFHKQIFFLLYHSAFLKNKMNKYQLIFVLFANYNKYRGKFPPFLLKWVLNPLIYVSTETLIEYWFDWIRTIRFVCFEIIM